MVSAADRAKGPARTSVWTEHRTSRGRRGSQPAGLDRGRIVDAAVRLLDAEGLAKFSMRRLAAELDVTAMSIYWYIDTKDDLLELALDAAFGTLRLPDGTTPDGTTPGAGDSPAAGSGCAPWPGSTARCWCATPGSRRWSAPTSTSVPTRWPSRSPCSR